MVCLSLSLLTQGTQAHSELKALALLVLAGIEDWVCQSELIAVGDVESTGEVSSDDELSTCRRSRALLVHCTELPENWRTIRSY